MTQAVPSNVAASVKQRLLNRARERKEDFNLLLTKYGLERILYRIGHSKYKVKLGIANTRMKDFHDLKTLSEHFQFDSESLVTAIQRTFERRKTALPVDKPPTALTEEFYADTTKSAQWSAFLSKNKLYIQSSSLTSVMTSIREFVMPLMQPDVLRGESRLRWEPSKAWTTVVTDEPNT